MLNRARWLMFTVAALLTLQSKGDGGFRLPDQPPKEETEGRSVNFGGDHGRSVSFDEIQLQCTSTSTSTTMRSLSFIDVVDILCRKNSLIKRIRKSKINSLNLPQT